MKWGVILVALLLIFGHLQTELSIFIQWIWPESKTIYIDPFLSGSYKFNSAASNMAADLVLLKEQLVPGEVSQSSMDALNANIAQLQGRKGISLLWWIYYCSNDMLWIITFFVLAKMAYQYSFRLFLVSCWYFLYHIADHVMLWVDYKTSGKAYWVLECVTVIAILLLLTPERKRAIIKSIK